MIKEMEDLAQVENRNEAYFVSWNSSCNNEISYSFNTHPAVIVFAKEERKEAFRKIRASIEESFKDTLEDEGTNYKGYMYYFKVVKYDIKNDVGNIKVFSINPLNMKTRK